MRKSGSGQCLEIKIVLLGKSYAGKTCLVERYVHERFSDNKYQNTIGAAFASKKITVFGKTVVLNVWDTAGSERYESMSKLYYRGAQAAILCYDLTEMSSFEKLRFWVSELNINEPNCKMYLCGTKKDLIDGNSKPRAVNVETAKCLAADLQSDLYETSSVTGETINDLFQAIAKHFVESKSRGNSSSTLDEDETLQLDENKKSSSWKCSCLRR